MLTRAQQCTAASSSPWAFLSPGSIVERLRRLGYQQRVAPQLRGAATTQDHALLYGLTHPCAHHAYSLPHLKTAMGPAVTHRRVQKWLKHLKRISLRLLANTHCDDAVHRCDRHWHWQCDSGCFARLHGSGSALSHCHVTTHQPSTCLQHTRLPLYSPITRAGFKAAPAGHMNTHHRVHASWSGPSFEGRESLHSAVLGAMVAAAWKALHLLDLLL